MIGGGAIALGVGLFGYSMGSPLVLLYTILLILVNWYVLARSDHNDSVLSSGRVRSGHRLPELSNFRAAPAVEPAFRSQSAASNRGCESLYDIRKPFSGRPDMIECSDEPIRRHD